MARHGFLPRRVGAVVAAWLFPAFIHGQQPQNAEATPAWLAADRAILAADGYQVPPPEIVKLVTAPRHLNVTLTQPSPDRRYFLKEQGEGLPSVNVFGKPHYYFAGLQVDFKANRARSLTTRGSVGLQLIDAMTGKSQTIETPKGATVSSSSWSPDGKSLAYIANFDTASYVFVADLATGKSTQVTRTPLLATLVTEVDWTSDGRSLVTVLLPDGRKAEPKRPAIATGPLVRLWTDGLSAPERNYASLLQEPYDAELMEYYVTGQLAVVDVKTRAVRKVGAPAMIQSVDASPDGQYFRVATLQKPFSYVVQYNAFPAHEEIWDGTGKVLAELGKRTTRFAGDTVGGGFGGRGSLTGSRRDVAWMPRGAGLYFIEQEPGRGGDSTNAGRGGRNGRGGGASRPDRLVQWLPPFSPNDTKVLYQNDAPMSQVVFSDDAKTIFVGTSSNGQGEIFAVHLDDASKKFPIVRQRGYTPAFSDGGRGGRGGGGGGGGRGNAADDTLSFYNNPGALVTKRGTSGGAVAMVSSDGAVFLQGTQYQRNFEQDAPRAFVDRVDIATGQKTRIYQAPADAAEAVAAALDDDFTKAVVNRESPREVANSFLRDMKTNAMTKLTSNVDYTPEFTNTIRKRITVTRADGFKFLVRLTLPADYKAGTRLPALFWFYPREYTEQAGYDRTLRTYNANSFPTAGARTLEYFTTQGYAVANFDPPIVGEQGAMNDNYVSDLVMNLSAVIDELDRQGYIDRTRLGIGGHSYGAFSTMNALVHTPFFKAGIAGDGMYNRTLTPDGFQSERRDLWSGQKTYLDMSPLLYADKLQGAVLMYHSLEDQNVGTDPISSIRMMQALRANGKTAALYLYPYEDHGPATRETDLDQWARWVAWMDIYVKHAGEAKGVKVVQ